MDERPGDTDSGIIPLHRRRVIAGHQRMLQMQVETSADPCAGWDRRPSK